MVVSADIISIKTPFWRVDTANIRRPGGPIRLLYTELRERVSNYIWGTAILCRSEEERRLYLTRKVSELVGSHELRLAENKKKFKKLPYQNDRCSRASLTFAKFLTSFQNPFDMSPKAMPNFCHNRFTFAFPNRIFIAMFNNHPYL